MPSPGFESGPPRSQSKSDNLDHLAMGPPPSIKSLKAKSKTLTKY